MSDTTIEEPPAVNLDVPAPEPTTDMSETWPMAFADGIKQFVGGDSATERFRRISMFEASRLRIQGQSGGNVLRAIMLARQRRPFRDQEELDRYGEQYREWWNRHVSEVRQAAINHRWRKNL